MVLTPHLLAEETFAMENLLEDSVHVPIFCGCAASGIGTHILELHLITARFAPRLLTLCALDRVHEDLLADSASEVSSVWVEDAGEGEVCEVVGG